MTGISLNIRPTGGCREPSFDFSSLLSFPFWRSQRGFSKKNLSTLVSSRILGNPSFFVPSFPNLFTFFRIFLSLLSSVLFSSFFFSLFFLFFFFLFFSFFPFFFFFFFFFFFLFFFLFSFLSSLFLPFLFYCRFLLDRESRRRVSDHSPMSEGLKIHLSHNLRPNPLTQYAAEIFKFSLVEGFRHRVA